VVVEWTEDAKQIVDALETHVGPLSSESLDLGVHELAGYNFFVKRLSWVLADQNLLIFWRNWTAFQLLKRNLRINRVVIEFRVTATDDDQFSAESFRVYLLLDGIKDGKAVWLYSLGNADFEILVCGTDDVDLMVEVIVANEEELGALVKQMAHFLES